MALSDRDEEKEDRPTSENGVPPAESPGAERMGEGVGLEILTGRVLRAGMLVMAAHVFEKLFGLLRSILISHYYGVESPEADTWALVFQGIVFPLFLIGEETLGPAFLPVFQGALDDKREDDAWKFARTVIFSYLAIIGLVCAAGILWPVGILSWFTELDKASGGGGGAAPKVLAMSVKTLPVFIIGLLGLSVGSITYVVLNGYKRFFLAAFGDSAFKISVIVLMILLANKIGIWALAIGVTIGGFAKVFTHFTGMPDKLRFLFRLKIDFRSKDLRKFLVLVAPLLLGILFARFRDYITNIFAISYLYENSSGRNWMSLNSFGKQIYLTVHRIIPYAVSIAMYPYFIEMIDKDDRGKLGEFITGSTRIILVLLLPVSFSLAALMEPLAQLLFISGKTSFATATEVGTINAVYVLVLAALAVETFLLQGFFSDRKMFAPIVIGIIFSSMVIAAAVIICNPRLLGLTGLHAVLGVGAAVVAARWLKMFVLVFWFRRGIPSFPAGKTLWFFLRLLLLSIVLGVLVKTGDHLLAARLDTSLRKTQVLRLVFGGAVSTAVYFAGCFLLRLEELSLSLRYAWRKIIGAAKLKRESR